MSRATVFVLVIMIAGCSRGPEPTTRLEYDQTSGRLKRIEYDYDKNGKNDTVSHMDGTRIVRIELDHDENGHVERWDFYGADRKVEKVGFASRNDGVMDSQAFYNADGSIARIELSTRRDGRFDRTEFYERGVLTYSADDANGDGKPEKWDYYAPAAVETGVPYRITQTAFDDSGSGRPERRFVYGGGGRIARVEVDPDGDGAFERMPKNR